jgi:serine/threonine protein kinase
MDQKLIDAIRKSLPNLKITGEIKRGGQKVVLSAHFNNIKAVFKIINPSDEEDENRALQEIEICSNFESVLFAKLYDYGRYNFGNDSVIYVVEEFINGDNLRDKLIKSNSNVLPQKEINRIISSLLDALEIVEENNLVHRDIKPENIIINDSRVVLIDFGIARKIDQKSITNSYAVFGPMTPGYAPPEQIRNEKRKISIRTDFFSLGVVFYEMLIGYNPFYVNSRSANDAINKTINISPKKLTDFGYNSSFDDFIFKCLEKNSHRRPSNVKQAKALFDKIKWGE